MTKIMIESMNACLDVTVWTTIYSWKIVAINILGGKRQVHKWCGYIFT